MESKDKLVEGDVIIFNDKWCVVRKVDLPKGILELKVFDTKEELRKWVKENLLSPT